MIYDGVLYVTLLLENITLLAHRYFHENIYFLKKYRLLTFCKKKNYDYLMDEILLSKYFILPILRYCHIELSYRTVFLGKESPRKHFKLSHRCKLWDILWRNIINIRICTCVLHIFMTIKLGSEATYLLPIIDQIRERIMFLCSILSDFMSLASICLPA
jgi:hypothetical protein